MGVVWVCVLAYPWILPLVRHGDDVPVEQVLPVTRGVAPVETLGRGLGGVGIPLQPGLDDVMVELL